MILSNCKYTLLINLISCRMHKNARELKRKIQKHGIENIEKLEEQLACITETCKVP